VRDRWTPGDDPLLRACKVRRLHERTAVGRPPKTDPKLAPAYAREIEAGLKRSPKRTLGVIFDAQSLNDISAQFSFFLRTYRLHYEPSSMHVASWLCAASRTTNPRLSSSLTQPRLSPCRPTSAVFTIKATQPLSGTWLPSVLRTPIFRVKRARV
jgi:hypothetical protein